MRVVTNTLQVDRVVNMERFYQLPAHVMQGTASHHNQLRLWYTPQHFLESNNSKIRRFLLDKSSNRNNLQGRFVRHWLELGNLHAVWIVVYLFSRSAYPHQLADHVP